LIDGGYVDTYKTYLLPSLREAAAKGNVIDVIVVTHIDGDHISGILKLLEEDEFPIPIGEIWYNGYRHVQSSVKISEEKENFVHRNICKQALMESKSISAKQGSTLSTLIARKKIPWNSPAKGGAMMSPLSFPLKNALVHILSPNNKDILEFGIRKVVKRYLRNWLSQDICVNL